MKSIEGLFPYCYLICLDPGFGLDITSIWNIGLFAGFRAIMATICVKKESRTRDEGTANFKL